MREGRPAAEIASVVPKFPTHVCADAGLHQTRMVVVGLLVQFRESGPRGDCPHTTAPPFRYTPSLPRLTLGALGRVCKRHLDIKTVGIGLHERALSAPGFLHMSSIPTIPEGSTEFPHTSLPSIQKISSRPSRPPATASAGSPPLHECTSHQTQAVRYFSLRIRQSRACMRN